MARVNTAAVIGAEGNAGRAHVRGLHAAGIEIVAPEDAELVTIATYDTYHAAQIEQWLSAGKHVLCEKPICQTFYELERIEDILKSNPDLILSTNYPLRQIAPSTHAPDHSFSAKYTYGRRHKIEYGWRGQIPGYSIALGAGTHLIDLVHNSTCERIRRVEMATARRWRGLTLYARWNVELESGLRGTIICDFLTDSPHEHRLHIDGRTWVNTEPTDTGWCIANFPVVSTLDTLDTHRVALAMDKAMRHEMPEIIDWS